MIIAFIVLQAVLGLFMALHDWIPLPPLNDLETLKQHDSLRTRLVNAGVNTSFVLVPLVLTTVYYPGPYPLWTRICFVAIYGVLTMGTLFAWWVPYFFGGTATQQAILAKFEKTHHLYMFTGINPSLRTEVLSL